MGSDERAGVELSIVPEVTHGLQHGIVKLDGPRDQERRVGGLGRHLARLGFGQERGVDGVREALDGIWGVERVDGGEVSRDKREPGGVIVWRVLAGHRSRSLESSEHRARQPGDLG